MKRLFRRLRCRLLGCAFRGPPVVGDEWPCERPRGCGRVYSWAHFKRGGGFRDLESPRGGAK